ncbi:MAG TPA: altronate dehydratase family protein, partial [Gemmatimonadales bacterium]|nr:altronate dehydratase family protein [Gemmatimonadales bacterium]
GSRATTGTSRDEMTRAIAAPPAVRIHPADDVLVAIRALPAGREIVVADDRVVLVEDVPAGHKIALRALEPGEPVVKYGFPIGAATAPIPPGAWVHSHNLKTRLVGTIDYRYEPPPPSPLSATRRGGQGVRTPEGASFMGYRRPNGRVGTRNEVWILNTVGCVNHAAERIARAGAERFAGRVDGVYSYSHPYGCGQLGDDLRNTQRALAGLLRHPNAGGVLVLGLGCESNQMDGLLRLAGDVDRARLRFFNSQDVSDEVEAGLEALAELVAAMERDAREECPAADLILGHKCGGSDGFSGITANPLVGRIADRLTALGGGVILTEVPEMFGAEQLLMNRAADEAVFRDIVALVNDFKEYFLRHGQPIHENPSPGNVEGGLTTLEEKSLGAIQKGGQATVTHVLRYGEPAAPGGLSLLEAPGNDGVSSTAMVASGATLLLFTTGRGTPLGFPVPTLKISSNTAIAEKKPHWIDLDAGALLGGAATMDRLEDDLFALILDVASGRALANNEKHGYREIAIWKEGVTL